MMTPPRVRKAVRRAVRLVRDPRRLRRQAEAGLSVVVTARESQAPFLAECLDSLSRQTLPHLQILLVPYGADPWRVVEAARPLAEVEPRLRVLEEVQATTLGAARNAGAAVADRDYLVFVGAGDIVPRNALARLVGALEQSGSDFARGTVVLDRPRAGEMAPGHGLEPVRRASLTEAPSIMSDFFIEGTVFRRHFWHTNGLAFAHTDGPGLDVCTASSRLAATFFDIVVDPAYRWMKRGTGRPVGDEPDRLADLDSWLRAHDEIRALLTEEDEVVRHAWLLGVLGGRLTDLLESVERASPSQWERVCSTVGRLLDLGGPDLLAQVPVVPRLQVWLAAQDRRAELEDLVDERRFERHEFHTLVESGVVYALLPFFRNPDHPVPDDLFALGIGETPLAASLQRVRWREDARLELDLLALIRNVSMPDVAPAVAVWLRDVETGERFDVAVEQYRDPRATRFAGMRFHSYDAGALSVVVDVDRLLAGASDERPRRWQLELDLTAERVTRQGAVSHRLQVGSAALSHPRSVAGHVVALSDEPGPVTLVARSAVARLVEADVSGRVVTGSIRLDRDAGAGELTASCGPQHVTAALLPMRGGYRFHLELPQPVQATEEPTGRHWLLRIGTAGGHGEPIAWPTGSDASWCGEGPASEVALRRTPHGNAEVVEVGARAQVDEAQLSESTLVVKGSWLGVPPPVEWTVVAHGERVHARGGRPVLHQDGRFEVSLPLLHDEWGLGPVPLPTGTYRLQLELREPDGGGVVEAPLLIADELEQRLPVDQRTALFRSRLGRGAAGRPLVRLRKPYVDEDLGRHAQQQLRARYRSSSPPLDENAVYLQSYSGHTATDSPLAVHELLRRTHPHLTLYWGVADGSTRLPGGAVPVMTHSQEWYDVLARAKYLVSNVDFERWFARKPGQHVLQTFHGYPAKSMGIGMWRAKNFGPRRIEAELDRTSRDWDLILTPAPEMDVHYRREYAYDGPILSHGYPRDDVLVSPGADELRRRTRERLGIRDDQVVVLYAPTWRDDLATSYRNSPLVQHLDLEAASDELGDGFVLLMRGHRFHSGARRSSPATRLVDVTAYPEINHLICASDVAVLDYSSLRFDFALTGRPMLFLVPDLERYTTGARGFLYPFESSAPGPLVRDAAEVVALLHDLDRVREDYRPAREQFHRTFNYLQDGHSAEHVVAAFFGDGSRAGAVEPTRS